MTAAEVFTADVVVLTGDRQVLLIERDWPPFKGYWALPGGHIDPGESARTAAARELLEETGVEVDPADLGRVGRFDAPGRDPRGRYVTAVFVAVLPAVVAPTAGSDASAAAWWPLAELPMLAFDHAEILAAALKTGVQP
ncbi:NUDIX domain-containing protein [Streptomyces atriruber]|uniref:NUDIX domain-containing protein n=1 Tax=Streptomyces atriruber TaxID=545121 RepID=UPI0006E45DC4|nr:NUDIX hydrolase [Streptomyces atriruber]